VRTVKNFEIKTLPTQQPLEIDKKNSTDLDSTHGFYTILKFVPSQYQNKHTPLQKRKKIQSRIFSFYFILRQNKKSGTLFLPFFNFPASFRLKKEAVGLNGLISKTQVKV
jgi:hypothetical protein